MVEDIAMVGDTPQNAANVVSPVKEEPNNNSSRSGTEKEMDCSVARSGILTGSPDSSMARSKSHSSLLSAARGYTALSPKSLRSHRDLRRLGAGASTPNLEEEVMFTIIRDQAGATEV